jgi:hypothetical protein
MKAKLVSILSVFAFILTPGVLRAQSTDDTESGAQEYVHRIVKPSSLATSTAAAGFDQAVTNPYEWGGGWAGFGRRLGSALGTHVVRSTIHFAVGKMLHEELSYHPSEKQGFGPRLKYALMSTVFTRKTTTGDRTVAVGEISGIVGGGFISRLWHPASYHTAASGFAATGVGFGAEAGMNVLHEFWPNIRHPHRHARNLSVPDKLDKTVAQAEAGQSISAAIGPGPAEPDGKMRLAKSSMISGASVARGVLRATPGDRSDAGRSGSDRAVGRSVSSRDPATSGAWMGGPWPTGISDTRWSGTILSLSLGPAVCTAIARLKRSFSEI